MISLLFGVVPTSDSSAAPDGAVESNAAQRSRAELDRDISWNIDSVEIIVSKSDPTIK